VRELYIRGSCAVAFKVALNVEVSRPANLYPVVVTTFIIIIIIIIIIMISFISGNVAHEHKRKLTDRTEQT